MDGPTLARPHSPSRARCKLLSHPHPTTERGREDENDDRSAANWSASKSESVRPLAARSFVLQFRLFRVDVRNSNSIAPQSHNLRYSTPSLTHRCSVLRSSSSPSCVCSSPELTKMISFTFVHSNAAPVCPLPSIVMTNHFSLVPLLSFFSPSDRSFARTIISQRLNRRRGAP